MKKQLLIIVLMAAGIVLVSCTLVLNSGELSDNDTSNEIKAGGHEPDTSQ